MDNSCHRVIWHRCTLEEQLQLGKQTDMKWMWLMEMYCNEEGRSAYCVQQTAAEPFSGDSIAPCGLLQLEAIESTGHMKV